MSKDTRNIIKTKIHTDILDTFGKSFKFKHGKGVAEWLKNSLDQYLRLFKNKDETFSGNWPVLIHLIDGSGQSKGPNLAVIDFGGTSYSAIEKFFLYWGDTSAASHGKTIKDVALTGGHGNGGKFYMREMWHDGARFLTWKSGNTTSLVVQKMKNNATGYFERRNETFLWQEAFNMALPLSEYLGGGQDLIEYIRTKLPNIYSELESQKRGFSVIVGRRAVQTMSSNDVVVGGRWKHQQLIDEICDAQQARRPIRELSITVFVNNQLIIERLIPHLIEIDENYPNETHILPGDTVSALNAGLSDAGILTITKSANQLTGRLKDLNSLFISDSLGNPIAAYPMHELSFPGYSPLLSFMHAELQVNFQEISRIVTNDRERLVESPVAHLILEFVALKIWEKIQVIEKINRENKTKDDLELAAILNETLNKHAQRFLQQVQTEILVDYVPSDIGGGLGKGGTGIGGENKGSGGSGKREQGEGAEKVLAAILKPLVRQKRFATPNFPEYY